jgi:AcrR family transcriptional regulator
VRSSRRRPTETGAAEAGTGAAEGLGGVAAGAGAADAPAAGVATDRRRRDTRARILDAAAALFAEHGYGATTVAEIEAAVGLRAGAGGLYRHFASKEDLLLAVVEGYRSRLALVRATLVLDQPAAVDAGEALQRVLLALVAFLDGERAMLRIGAELAALPRAAQLAIGRAWDEAHGIFADLFERSGLDPSTARACGVAALGQLAHYFGHLRSFGAAPLRTSLEDFLAVWAEQWQRVLGDGARASQACGRRP